MPPFSDRFRALVELKTREAEQARIDRLQTVEDRSDDLPAGRIGNAWTRRHYNGDFYLLPLPPEAPAVSLVFVQSRDGNTVADTPADLGGGPIDRHLIYEGLTRVAADGVLAGAATATGRDLFFSIWHPEMVALRRALSLPRHPAQIIVSNEGRVDLTGTLLFNVPDVPTFVIAGAVCRDRCAHGFAERPWITIVPMAPGGLRDALVRLRRDHRIERVSAIGGRTTASGLLDAGLVQDLCLTTTARQAGTPNTPFYTGRRPPAFNLLVRKEATGAEPIRFDHLVLAEKKSRVFSREP